MKFFLLKTAFHTFVVTDNFPSFGVIPCLINLWDLLDMRIAFTSVNPPTHKTASEFKSNVKDGTQMLNICESNM
jgi:hypothetical protein